MAIFRRWVERSALLTLLLAAAGCGPGVGGTGTGEGFSLDYFGARAASVCTADFADALKCPARIVVGPTRVDLSGGSELVLWVDEALAARVHARIEGSDIEFRALCEGVRFRGTWGVRADGSARFFGNYVLPGGDAAAAGIMEADAQSAALTLTLRDLNGDVVFGPVALQRAEATPASPTCLPGGASPQIGAGYR